jgi:lipopolysaccharide export system protein LptA
MMRAAVHAFLVACCAVATVTVESRAQIGGGSAPIEITADTLVVEQKRKRATFSGTVDAVQGELVLSADKLRVHYRGNAEVGQAGGSPTSIRLIEAFGNVLLSSPEETAQGEKGVYDVDTRIVTLEGSVVLTKDENVIEGDRLKYDLKTGRSQVFSAAGVAEAAEPEPVGRVRAVFVPEQDGEDASEAKGADGEAAGRKREAAAPEAGPADTGGRHKKGWPPLPPRPKPAADG